MGQTGEFGGDPEMTIQVKNLRALFPSLYSRRDPHTADSNARDWVALRMPNLRLMGPNWTVTVKLNYLKDYSINQIDGVDNRVLAQSAELVDLNDEAVLHRPTLMQASVADIAEADGSLSQYNAVAVNIADPDDSTKLLQPYTSKGIFPWVDATQSFGAILAPFGVVPQNKETEPSRLFFPASRLVHGEIWTIPSEGYLAKLRAELGVFAPPETDGNKDKLVLLPEGIAFRGALSLPWQVDNRLPAWILLEPARLGERDAPSLSLWARPGIDAGWQSAISQLNRGFQSAGTQTTAPRWLSVRTASALIAADLRWPCIVKSEILATRDINAPMELTGEQILINFGADTEGQTGRLSVRPKKILIESDGDELALVSGVLPEAEPAVEPDENRTDAQYTFDLVKADGKTQVVENLKLGRGEKDKETVSLAVPTLSNATRLRDAMGFEAPLAREAKSAVLWLFTPLTNGWLHWPFPNVTRALADLVLPKDADTAQDDQIEFETSGVWSMRPDEMQRERGWSVRLTDAIDARFRIRFKTDDPNWEITLAKTKFDNLSLSVDGVLPVTAFRQTQKRLLPETQDRALRADQLNAVSPAALHGDEKSLWQSEKLRVTATLTNLSLHPDETASTGAKFTSPEGGNDLSIQFSWPQDDAPFPKETPSPWLWLRHDKLPSFQTMPLCTAGEANREPSSLRELTPLVLKDGVEDGLQFSRVFNMSVPGVEIYRAAEYTAAHPMAEASYRFEVGQAITTLASLTLRAGDDAKAMDGSWGGISTSLTPLYRHDIALTDELFTLAELPPKAQPNDQAGDSDGAGNGEDGPEPQPDESSADPLPVFTPFDYNDPGNLTAAPWSDVWRGHSRALALSAPSMNVLSDGGATLSDLFLGFDVDAASLKFVETVSAQGTDAESTFFEDTGTQGDVSFIGEIKGTGKVFKQMDTLLGLPAVSDLTGLSADLNDGYRLTRGTLDGMRENPAFDQAGWRIGGPEDSGAGLLRNVARVDPLGASQSEPQFLFTLSDPVALDTAGVTPVEFHFRDVLFAKIDEQYSANLDVAWTDDANNPDAFGRDKATLASQPNTALKHGFYWSLTAPRSDFSGVIPLGPFLFEPVALRSVTLDLDHQLASAKIVGRIGLPGDAASEFVPNPGRATLVLSRNAAAEGQVDWVLHVQDLALPMRDEDDSNDGPPYLIGHDLMMTMTNGHLGFELADPHLSFRLKGELKSSAENTEVTAKSGLDLEVAFAEQSVESDFILLNTKVDAVEHARLKLPILSSSDMRASAFYRVSLDLGCEEYDLKINQFVDVIQGVVIEESSILEIGAANLPIEVELSVSARSTSILWASQAPDHHILGLPVTTARGAALLALSVENGEPKPGETQIHTCAMSLGSTVTYQFDSTLDPHSGRLSGQIDNENLFSWPKLDVQTLDILFSERATGHIEHHACVTVDNVRAKLAVMGAGKIAVIATVQHKLTELGQDNRRSKIAKWSVFQTVSLWAPENLAMELEQRSQASDAFSVRAQNYGVQNRPYLQKTAEAGHFGLTPDQMKSLATNVRAHAAVVGALVDVSAHFLVDDGTPSGKQRPVPLPGFVPTQAIGFSLSFSATDKTFERQYDAALDQGLYPFPRRVTQSLQQTLIQAQENSKNTGIGDALDPVDKSQAHQPLFQSATAVKLDGKVIPEDAVWAEIAIWLSVFADKTKVSRTVRRQAYGWRRNGWIAEEMLDEKLTFHMTKKKPPRYTADAHALSWSADYLSDVAKHLFPRPPNVQVFQAGHAIKLVAIRRSGQEFDSVAEMNLDAQHESAWAKGTAVPDRINDWARAALARLAPWARNGLLVTVSRYLSDDGQLLETIQKTKAVLSNAPEFSRDARVAQIGNTAGLAQPQRSVRPALSQPAHVPDGYLQAGTASATFLSEDSPLPETGQTPARLTASGTGFAATLRSGTRHVMPDEFWLLSRMATPFRAFDETGRTVTQALPPGLRSAVPTTYLTGRHADATVPHVPDPTVGDTDEKTPASRNTSIPPFVMETMVAPRSGIATAHRFGLQHGNATKTDWSASEAMQWVRTARPVELGVNDRPVASAFDDRQFQLQDAPDAMVFGPAAGLSRMSASDGSLDRSPRALFAHRIDLRSPPSGLIPELWDGRIGLRIAQSYGELASELAWNVEDAYLDLGDQRYISLNLGGPLDPTEDLVISDFQNETKDGSSVAEAVRALQPGTECRLTLFLQFGALTRRVGLKMWRAGGRLIETPAYMRFEDPSYNDILTGQPKMERSELTGSVDELLLIAENKEVRPGDFLETGLSIASGRKDGPAKSKFVKTLDDASILIGTTTYELKFEYEVQRPGSPAAMPVLFKNAERPKHGAPDFAGRPLRLSTIRRFIDNATSYEESPEFELLPKDRLRIIAIIGDAVQKISLTLDVVDRPNLPPNPAIYHLLSLGLAQQEDQHVVHAPFQVTSPDPFVVELVDPSEMALGIVRRRAVFQWATFVPPQPDKHWWFGLQKDAKTGAASLGNQFGVHWQSLGNAL